MPAEPDVTPALAGLSPVHGKLIVACFHGGHPTSDGSILALREIEQAPASQTASYAASFVTASSLLVLLSPVPAPRFGHFPVPPPPGE